MEIIGSFCDGFLDIDLSKLKNEKYCYPYHLISYCLYKEKVYNNNCMRYEYYEQFKYLSRISSVDKLIEKNRNKMKKKIIPSIPQNIRLTRQQGKMFSETKQNISKNLKEKNQQIKQEYINKDTSTNNKSILSNTNKKPVKNTHQRTKKSWSEIYTERRKSRRLSNLPPLDIKVEIKREEIWESYDSLAYDLFTNNVPVKEIKQEIINNTESVNLEQEKNVQPIKNSPSNESYTSIDLQDNNLDEFQNENIKKYDQTFNYRCPSLTTNKNELNTLLQPIRNSKNSNTTQNAVVLENITKTNLIITENNFKDTNDSNTIKIFEKSENVPKITTFFEPNGDSNYIISHEHKNLDDEVVEPIILKCWSFNTSDRQTNITDELTKTKVVVPQSETHFNKTQTQEVQILPTNYKSNTINNRTHTSSKIHCEKTAIDKLTLQKKNHNTIKMKKCTKKKIDYSKMTIIEKKLYRKKLSFVYALGLMSKKELKKKKRKNNKINDKSLISKKSPYCSKILTTDNETACNETSSDKVRCSYLLKYENDSTLNDKTLKHIAIPILIRHNTSGSSFHPERTCMLKCSSCHKHFGSSDITCHMAQIKNPNKQKACLENTSHLIGPTSCLCSLCFEEIKIRSSITNIDITNICVVMNCSVVACHIFKTLFLKKINVLLNQKGVVLRQWLSEVETVGVCDLHNDQILDISKCQFCGSRTTLKYDLQKSELHAFQAIFNKDGIPVTVNKNLLVCNSCRMYFLWRVCKNTSNVNINSTNLRDELLTRICAYHQINVPTQLFESVNIESQEKEFNIKVPNVGNEVEIQPNMNKCLTTSKPVKPVTKKNKSFKLIEPVTHEEIASLKSTQSITNKILSSLKPIQPNTNKNILPMKPIQPITNKNILPLKPVKSVMPKTIEDTRVVMIPLQPVKNKKNSIQQRPTIHKEIINDIRPHLKTPIFVPVLKPVNSSQYQAPTILPSSTQIIKSFRQQPVLKVPKLLHPSMISSTVVREPRLNSTVKPPTQTFCLKNNTLRLFKNFQIPYQHSKELLNHLLVLEKYRAQGHLLKMNNTSQIKTKNNNSHSSVITDGDCHPFQQLPNNLMTRDLCGITQNNIKPLGNDCPLNTSLHKNIIKKPLPISKHPVCKSNEKLNIKINKIKSLSSKQPMIIKSKNPTATPLAIASSSTITSIPTVNNTNKVNEKLSTIYSYTINPKTLVNNNKPPVIITSVSNADLMMTFSPNSMNFVSGNDVIKEINPNNKKHVSGKNVVKGINPINKKLVLNPIKNGIKVNSSLATSSKSLTILDPKSLFSSNNTYWMDSTATGAIPAVTVRTKNGKLLSMQQLRKAISKGGKIVIENSKT